MFEDYLHAVNKEFGIYEAKMIELGNALLVEATHLEDVANYTSQTADAGFEVVKNVRKFLNLTFT